LGKRIDQARFSMSTRFAQKMVKPLNENNLVLLKNEKVQYARNSS
jgi:hypothetical protein